MYSNYFEVFIIRSLLLLIAVLYYREQYHGKLECEFNADERLSALYTLMQSLKTDHHIETYGVSNHSSLDTVFMDRVAASAPQSN